MSAKLMSCTFGRNSVEKPERLAAYSFFSLKRQLKAFNGKHASYLWFDSEIYFSLAAECLVN